MFAGDGIVVSIKRSSRRAARRGGDGVLDIYHYYVAA